MPDTIELMASLLGLLHSYPILENLVTVLPLGDLFNLSRTSSTIRAALHGFSVQFLQKPSLSEAVRPALSIGSHNTSYWKNLKAKSPLYCSEPQHTKGDKVKGCLMCSMPVCEACIIKASFGRHDENTFPSRIRSLCVDCFNLGNPHREISSLDGKGNTTQTSYLRRTECTCTAKDGHLCLKCKTKQNAKLDCRGNQCFGMGCSTSKTDYFGGRVCLWCNHPLPHERSRAESRRIYDARHLLARRHSSYDQSPKEGPENDVIDTAEQEAIWNSSDFTSSATARMPSPKKANVKDDDRFEVARKQELQRVSKRRQYIAAAEEEQRWYRSETLRRSESECHAPPPIGIPGPVVSLAAPSSIGALIRTAEDDSSPPSYESCT